MFDTPVWSLSHSPAPLSKAGFGDYDDEASALVGI
jgi:hypothetical protein